MKRVLCWLAWMVIIEAIIIGGMIMAFASIVLDPICLAAEYEEAQTEEIAEGVDKVVASLTACEVVETAPVYEEEEFVRFPASDEVYKVVNGIPVTYKELHILGLTIWGEANGQSKMEQAAVAWSILNRVDEEGYARGKSLTHVITFPGQFHGYKNTKGARCSDYYLELAKDVVDRWAAEHEGEENVGRVLPKEYTFFAGKKVNGVWHNYFRTAYKTNEPRWDWSLPNPYEEA